MLLFEKNGIAPPSTLSPSTTPPPTPPEESMSIHIDRSQPPSPSSSPVVTPPEHSAQVTPQEQTPPSPAFSGCQQMLRLENPMHVCYANAGTNFLFSSPLVTTFLSTLPDNISDLNIVIGLAKLTSNFIGDLKNLRNKVTEKT